MINISYFDHSQSRGVEAYPQDDVYFTMETMRKVPSLELFKADAFRMQQTAFCVLTLLVLGLLLLLHTAFAFRLGEPSTLSSWSWASVSR